MNEFNITCEIDFANTNSIHLIFLQNGHTTSNGSNLQLNFEDFNDSDLLHLRSQSNTWYWTEFSELLQKFFLDENSKPNIKTYSRVHFQSKTNLLDRRSHRNIHQEHLHMILDIERIFLPSGAYFHKSNIYQMLLQHMHIQVFPHQSLLYIGQCKIAVLCYSGRCP